MNRILAEFDQITKIPRPSHQEGQIAAYLYEWAKKHDLYVEKDQNNNVYMKLPATKGFENKSSIALQAHTDMVCQKAADVDHNFAQDPIEYFIDGDTVSTRGKTTLGADNGLGVALILAIFSDDNCSHPALEGIFTTGEEDDFYGAAGFDGSKLKSQYLINLDNGDENSIICASAGGITIDATRKFNEIKLTDDNYATIKLSLSGFLGGHSGNDINKGRGNTNLLMMRFLATLTDLDFYLSSIDGGTFKVAIPRETTAVLKIKKSELAILQDRLMNFKEQLQVEFASIAAKISLVSQASSAQKVMSTEDFLALKNYVLTVPIGVEEMSDVFLNLVDASCNLAKVSTQAGQLTVVSDIRANTDSKRAFISNKIQILATAFGFTTEAYAPYYSWSYKADSPLRDLVESIYNKNNDQSARALGVHAGLECGYFDHKKTGMDIVSIGPDSWDYHSPHEAFSLSSLEHFYENLKEILQTASF
ncbi:MAG TPA: beta-Ala-His dipeptidase [Tetragenococcus sp.]|nr:beta-Ala-His dipeptidase [Tetragenococcus sp.]